MGFYSTQYSLFRVSQSLQLLFHFFYHHGEWGFSMRCQVCSSQFWYSRTQTFWVLLCQNRRDGKNTTGLGKKNYMKKTLFSSKKLLWLLIYCVTAFPTWRSRAALLTMFVNWKMFGLNFSCMSQRKSTASLVESRPTLATAETKLCRAIYSIINTANTKSHGW